MSANVSSEPSDSRQPSSPANQQRLQRVLAAAGIGSRRECELIILEGRVEVDGQVVVTLGTKVDPDTQKIFVDGQRITMQRLEYYMLNKPPGVLSTSNDPSGRARVIDLIKTNQRVYNVGRLDQSSEGMILVTNDGELANRLTHPKYGIEKKYQVKVDGVPTPQQLRSLEEGVYIAEGKAKAESAKLLRKSESSSWIEIVLSEGKNREIRRILAKLGHKVRVLKRVAIGPLKMADLPVGAHRRLTTQEIKMLKRAAEGLAPLKKSNRKSTKTNSTKFIKGQPVLKAKGATSKGVTSSTDHSGKPNRQPNPVASKKARPNRKSGPKQISQLIKPKSKSEPKPDSKFKPDTRSANSRSVRPKRQANNKGRNR